MSSTIFYRFKSQKDTSRISFDGTGLTVFDLKREIIINNRLGDGTDFQLRLYSVDTGEEYEEDQIVIPRSSTVIVRRSPAYRPVGMGSLLNGNTRINTTNGNTILNATRYVTGKPRITKKKPTTTATTLIPNGSGIVSNNFNSSSSTLLIKTGNNNGTIETGITEEERIARMFATQANEWERTQEEMSSATPVIFRNNNSSNSSHGTGGGGGGNSNRGQDEGPPPAGYMCYRCGSRNHWIKNCPTNNDPNFEGKRIKRTTGIPKKFLQNVEIDTENMTPEEMLRRKVMVTDDGKFVVQVEDKQSWDEYQRRQEQIQLKLNGDNSFFRDNDIRWRPNYYPSLPNDLKCPITGGILKDAVRTSNCCNKIFSKNALEDLLLDNDFVCPSCGHEDILLDSLTPEETIRERVKQYMEEHDKNENNKKRSIDNNEEKEKTMNKGDKGENRGENKGTTGDVINEDSQDNEDQTINSKKIRLNEPNNNGMPAMPPPAALPFVPMPFVPMFPPFIPTPPMPTVTASINTNTTSGNINNKDDSGSAKK